MNYKAPIVLTGLMIAAMIFSKPALAHMEKGDHAEFLKSLRQASDELKATDPALSAKLSGYADKRESRKAKWAEKKEEFKKQRQEDAVKIRAAATELQATRKDLAADLNAIADRCEKKMKEHEEEKPEVN